MRLPDDFGYPLVMHIHDEEIAETPTGLFDLDHFLAMMEEPVPWAPGLPLKAAGYVATRYKKE